MKINYKRLIIFILIPLLLGFIFGIIFIKNSQFDSIIPAWIFPVAWTILYILMGISSYLIYEDTLKIPKIYIQQLIVNLLWTIIFFKFKLLSVAFLWIIFLIILVIYMIKEFLNINKIAGYLQIPYAIWLVVALILNFIYLLK